jgi:putative protease
MYNMVLGQIGKSTGNYRFSIAGIHAPEELPFMSASSLNAIRRRLAEELDGMPCIKKDILLRKPGKVTKPLPQKDITYKTNISNQISEDFYREAGAERIDRAYELRPVRTAELMRTKYCIRFELGLCPKYQGGKAPGQLFLLNNGQKFALHFDCKACEMTLTQA